MSQLLKISEAASLAIHTMMMLAAKPGVHQSTKSIAETLDVSEAHLAKVMQRLARLDMVHSTRGPKGGFVLAKAPDTVTLLDIYEAIEGPLEPPACLLHKPVCDGSGCIFGGSLKEETDRLKKHLETTSLSALALKLSPKLRG